MRKVQITPGVADYSRGYNDALNGRMNLKLSKMYTLGYTEGLSEKYDGNNEEPELLEKHSGIYLDE